MLAVQRAQLAISNSLWGHTQFGSAKFGVKCDTEVLTLLRENSPENLCAARTSGAGQGCGAGALR